MPAQGPVTSSRGGTLLVERHDILLTLAVPAGAGRAKLADAIFKLGPRVME